MDPTKIYEDIDSRIASMDENERSGYFEHLRALYPQELGAKALSGAGAELDGAKTREVPLTTEQRRMKEVLLGVKKDDIVGHLQRLSDGQRAQAEHPQGVDEPGTESSEESDNKEQEANRMITDSILSIINEDDPYLNSNDRLSYRERKIITARFGLNGQEPRTLTEIGFELNISRQRVRQIQNQTQNKIYYLLYYKASTVGEGRLPY